MKFPDPNFGYHFDYRSHITEKGILLTFLRGKVRILFRFEDIVRAEKDVYRGGAVSWDVIRWGKCPSGTQALRIILKKGCFRNHMIVFEDLEGAIDTFKNKDPMRVPGA